ECAGGAARLIHPPEDAPSFDSEALWAELQRLRLEPRKVLIVRGGRGVEGHGRSWMAEQFRSVGADVTLYAAYRREPVVWPPQRRRQLRAWRAGSLRPVWFLSSREALDALVRQMGASDLLAHWMGCRIIVPHERIGQAVGLLANSCGIATRFG